MNKRHNKILRKAFDNKIIDEIDIYNKKEIFRLPYGELINTLNYTINNYKGNQKVKDDLIEMKNGMNHYLNALDNLFIDISEHLPDIDYRFGHGGKII
jgi:hypothetical protein